jgi:hypothetical protein
MKTLSGDKILANALKHYPPGTLSRRDIIMTIQTDDPTSLWTRLNPIVSNVIWGGALASTTPSEIEADLQRTIKTSISSASKKV